MITLHRRHQSEQQQNYHKKFRSQASTTLTTTITKTFDKSSCVFCVKVKQQGQSYAQMLNRALYTKYSSSQNYYYQKDINDILENFATSAVIKYKDICQINEDEEYLDRFFYSYENRNRRSQLTEYYKYHKDIPRIFMDLVCVVIHKFHDKKRRLEYGKIKRQLGMQCEEKVESISLTQHRKDQSRSKDCTVGQLNNLLKNVNITRQQPSCTLMLRDFLNSVLKHEYNSDNSFLLDNNDNSRYLSESIFSIVAPKQPQKQKYKQGIIIPQINMESININQLNIKQPMSTRQKNQKIKLPAKFIQQAQQLIKGAQTTREVSQQRLQVQKDISIQQALIQMKIKQTPQLSRTPSMNQEQFKKLMPLLQLKHQEKILEKRKNSVSKHNQPKTARQTIQQTDIQNLLQLHKTSRSQKSNSQKFSQNHQSNHFVQSGLIQPKIESTIAIKTKSQDQLFPYSQPTSPLRTINLKNKQEVSSIGTKLNQRQISVVTLFQPDQKIIQQQSYSKQNTLFLYKNNQESIKNILQQKHNSKYDYSQKKYQ